MSTLVLRLAGPMQAWGSASRFDDRDTGGEPTRSGVIGLLAAALGLGRDQPIGDLAEVRLGVRIDRGGTLLRDFQTIQFLEETTSRRGGPVDGTRRTTTPVVSPRTYLEDAVFTAGIEHADRELLLRLGRALVRPRYVLSLGRRACLPTRPLVELGPDGEPLVAYHPLEAALAAAPIDDRLPRRFVIEVADASPRPVLGRPTLLETRYDSPEQDAFGPVGRLVRRPRTVGIFDHPADPVRRS